MPRLQRRRRPRLLRLLTAAALLGAMIVTAPAATATAAPNAAPPLAATPPMGFNDWAGFGCNISEKLFTDTADQMVKLGLDKLGYRYVNIDDCWMQKDRDGAGNLQVDTTRFPHGMKWLGDYLHARGLKFGIYEDAGYKTCQGAAGSYGHFQADANLYASWGVDYLKLDYCYQPLDRYPGKTAAQVAQIVYTQASDALKNTGRPIVFSESAPAYYCCSGKDFWDIMGWIGNEGQLWRYGSDIADDWDSVLRNYTEGNTTGLPAYGGPNHWNDADMLEVGNGGMTSAEYQAQATVWAEMASPILFSTDLTHASADTVRILSNKDLIAVDQDALGKQGTIVKRSGNVDALSRPLSNGDHAVVLFNKGNTAANASVTAKQAGLPAASGYRLTDLWTKKVTGSTGTIAASVPAHSAVIYRVKAGTAAGLPPATAVTLSNAPFTAGHPTPTTVTVTNNGASAVTAGTLALTVPTGWTAKPTAGTTFTTLPPGRSAGATWTVTPTTPPPGETLHLTGTAAYRWQDRQQSATGAEDMVSQTPWPNLAAAFNNVGSSDESNPTAGNFDGDGDSYSRQALAKVGLTPGAALTHDGLTFHWPSSAAGAVDNVAGGARKVAVTGTGTKLGFLGAEAGGDTGQVLLTYTDGSTQTANLAFPNWCCTSTTGYDVVAATDHRNTPSGPANFGTAYDVFYTKLALPAGKTLATVTLPAQRSIHVFAVAVG